MNERTPKFDPVAHELLLDLASRMSVAAWDGANLAGLDKDAREKVFAAVAEEAQRFIYERPRPALKVVK